MLNSQLRLVETEATEAAFRPIQYLGNKWRALAGIEYEIEELSPGEGPVLDLFTGSGVIAAKLGRKRPVIAADIQEYSRVLASAMLTPRRIPDSIVSHLRADIWEKSSLLLSEIGPLIEYEELAIQEALADEGTRLAEVLEHGSIMALDASSVRNESLTTLLRATADRISGSLDNVLTRYYAGVYFAYRQSAELDAIASCVRSLPNDVRITGLAAVLSTASQLVSTVGNQFAQPIRPRSKDGHVKHSALRAVARTRQLSTIETFMAWLKRYQELPPAEYEHQALRGDYREILDQTTSRVSAIYADPPYTRDHYSRFYHVLETISLGDEPQLSQVSIGSELRASRGLYRAERHQSPFCIKSEVHQAFRDLAQGAAKHDVPLIISYSPYTNGSAARPQTRLMTIAEIESIVAEHFSEVDVKSLGRITHSKLNAQRLNIEVDPEAELLIIGRP
jgi:adenine-specific DNA-methyltransferase